MSVLVVLIGGPHDGREFHVPGDDPIIISGELDVPEFDYPPPEGPCPDLVGAAFTLLRYRWDGTTRADGALRFSLEIG